MRRWIAGGVGLSVALAGCGHQQGSREPLPAPSVQLSDADRRQWKSPPRGREEVPVLLYRGVAPADFARQMSLLDHAGYDTVPLEDFVRFVNGEHVALPPRPLLVTFDGGQLATWRENDAILRESGLNAVVFVNVGCVQNGDPECLTWSELERMQASGRWDVQLQAVTAAVRIKYGPASGDVGAFYAYRGTDEVLAGWRQRAFSDITNGEQRLSENVDGYRPLAFAPPFGNYGQAGTNDPRIPRELLARIEQSFAVVFTQDRSGFARPGAPNPLGRFEITREVTDQELRALLAQAS